MRAAAVLATGADRTLETPGEVAGGVVTLVLLVALVVSALWVGLVVVPRDRRPSSALAWMLLIYLLPLAGLLAFALIGSPKLPVSRRDRQREMDRRIEARVEREGRAHDPTPGPAWLDGVVRQNTRVGRLPMLRGNAATLHGDYDAAILAMADDIASAREHVHVEFYILSLDDTTEPFFAALEQAVANGADVRVLFDHIGSAGYPGYRATRERLTRAGVRWALMLPVQPWRGRYQRPDLRNHRKLVVVDGAVGWAGSQNLIDRSYDKPANVRRGLQWQDLMVRLRGPAVQALDAVFVTDWYSETDELLGVRAPLRPRDARGAASEGPVAVQVLPSGPGFETDNNLLMFDALLFAARTRVSITSPYFVPDESLLAAVVAAALRGCDVELFVPARADQALVHHAQRSYYEELLRAGVRIFLYPAPYVLHAKHVSIDDDVAVIGSSDLDIRSFALDLESSLLCHDRAFVDALREVEDSYRARSRELTLAEWVHRPRHQRVLDNLARLTSAVQ
ncbi:cardiolipin synthase [Aquipuribacter nitratireducens]|uniref:Cardiolipin synthase n=1 Tax=Aquipuribacter nitratireducens TaxID=650104 RepID=A0ABW0GR56_9MICO